MKNYVNEISEVMFDYDIEDIIFDEMYQADEYDSEAKMVFENINADMTIEEMAGLCKQVYDCMFLSNHNVEQFIEMAEEILKIVGKGAT